MQFYEVTGIVESLAENDGKMSFSDSSRYSNKLDVVNEKYEGKAETFIVKLVNGDARAVIIVTDPVNVNIEKIAGEVFESLQLEAENLKISEIKLKSFLDAMDKAEYNHFINSSYHFKKKYKLSAFDGRMMRSGFEEGMVEVSSKESIYKDADKYLMRESLRQEFDRIFACMNPVNVVGHPVHYLLTTVDKNTRNETTGLLLKALHSSGRIHSRRFGIVTISNENVPVREMELDAIYKSSIGGTVVINVEAADEAEGNTASAIRDELDFATTFVKRYLNKVLTVFCVSDGGKSSKEYIYENLPGVSFVELSEELAYGREARSFLRALARDAGIEADRKLLSKVVADKGYFADELHLIFDEWYNRHLKNVVYPAYKGVAHVSETERTKINDKKFQDFESMVGLDAAKEVINEAVDYYKAQKMFSDKGMKSFNPSMHMVFTGNPGTAKTTCARYFADIMKANHVLSRGHLVEVGRKDLVGRFVGWTAKIVQHKFKEARGGVLFIDEAYALCDGHQGSFGDEAINTIVQEMENNRNDTIVIFAGYPEKMEDFINRNPGLKSRIAFHVPFEDYTVDELVQISEHMASSAELKFTDEAKEKLRLIYDAAICDNDFGNGRYVRNVIEKARRRQSSRLLKKGYDKVTGEDILTIEAEDIDMDLGKRKPVGVAEEELRGMVGLTDAKDTIFSAVNYFMVKKKFSEVITNEEKPSMHMVFTGNSGTAKTTCARLFAEIMRDNHIIPKGHLVEVGRADIVGKYQGCTAPLIKEKFKEAKGGVLFIDEAYSLVENGGSYGDEAINTIVQEMENHREDTVVIFAGYPNEMRRFIEKNPGLQSRIAFNIEFNDYSAEELFEIAEYMAQKSKIRFSEEAKAELKNHLRAVTGMSDLGNGRYIRNLLQESRFNQANRLVKLGLDNVTEEQLTTIEVEDLPRPKENTSKKHFGFS